MFEKRTPKRQIPIEKQVKMPDSKRSVSWFTKFAKKISWATGRPTTFALAILLIIVWGITGPLFKFSDTWQLVINTGTTIITFLMVFLIQNTQNRDTEALQLKLDELIRSTRGAKNILLDLEELEYKDMDHIRDDFERLTIKARRPKKPRKAARKGPSAVGGK